MLFCAILLSICLLYKRRFGPYKQKVAVVDRVLFVAVKRGNIRGELFNTSFLLLCHIGQVYGRKVGFGKSILGVCPIC